MTPLTPRAGRVVRPVCAALALIYAGACQQPVTDTSAAAAAAPPADLVTLTDAAQSRAGVTTEAAAETTRADVMEAPGVVAVNEARTARIGSLVEGNVMEVFVQAGARVTAGQALAHLHTHVAHDARAGYRKALADERRLVTELRFMTDAEQRANRLFTDKAIALQDLQRAQANRVAATEALDVARAEIERARAELDHYGLTDNVDPSKDHDQVPVSSPIAGAVLERLVTEGTAVVPGEPLFVVSDLSRLWVLAEVDEAQLAKLRVGRPVTVRVAAYPSDTFAGSIAQIADAVSHTTRRVTVRCDVPNPDGRLKPEMFANVLLEESEPRRVITVPSAAVQTVRGATGVFVAESGGKFRLKPVELGADRGGDVEIRKGLSAGEKVVVGGAFALKSELLASSVAAE